jgi:DNA-binding LytR/AlgR family response regulator
MIIPLIGEDGVCQFINPKDNILYLQTNKSGKVRFYSAMHIYKPVQSVEEWSGLLSPAGFVRVDRGTIVNLNKVNELDPDLGVLDIKTENGGKMVIPVTRAMMRRLQAEMKSRL